MNKDLIRQKMNEAIDQLPDIKINLYAEEGQWGKVLGQCTDWCIPILKKLDGIYNSRIIAARTNFHTLLIYEWETTKELFIDPTISQFLYGYKQLNSPIFIGNRAELAIEVKNFPKFVIDQNKYANLAQLYPQYTVPFYERGKQTSNLSDQLIHDIWFNIVQWGNPGVECLKDFSPPSLYKHQRSR
jgi:hypothetical protein